MPSLTCITTTFNDGAALGTSVAAVLAQGFGDFEFLIVDDGSTDPETAALLAGLDDPRVRVIRQANAGLSSARNRALAQARGDYVCFLDADDSRPGWAFAAIAAAIERDAPDVILCRGFLSEIRGELLPFYDDDRFARIAELCPEGSLDAGHPEASRIRALTQLVEPQSANKVVRTAFLRETGIGFPDTHFFEDIYFHTLVLAAARRVGFLHTPCFAYFRRYGRPQITATADARRFDIIAVTRMTLQTFAARPEFHDPLHRAAVLASCLRILDWCGRTVSHQHRFHHHQMTRAMLRLVDPLWLHVPAAVQAELGAAGAVLARHLEALRHAG